MGVTHLSGIRLIEIGYGQWQGPTVSSLLLSIGLANGERDACQRSGLDSGSIQPGYVLQLQVHDMNRQP